MRRRATVTMLAAAALFGAACNSSTSGGVKADGLLDVSGRAEPRSDGLSDGVGSSASDDPLTSSTDAQGRKANSARSGTAGGTSPSAVSAGAPPKGGEILIGAEIDHDNTAAYQALGVKGVASGDQEGMVNAMVKWVNTHGGMGGRTVVPVIHESQVETSSFAAQAQAACSDFTEDHRVFAVVGRTSDRDDLFHCLAPKGVPFVAQHRYLWDRRSLVENQALLYVPGGLGGARWDAWVNSLATTGFFAPKGTFGVVRFDTPAYERTYKETVEPAIRRVGSRVKEEVVIHQPEAVGNFGSTGGEIGNAILRLKASNVDHLLILDEGTIIFLFMPAAESQGYRPRYGLHSQNIPQVLSVNVPKAQLKAAVGAGWVPTLDVDFAQDPGGMPGYAECRAIYKQAAVELAERVAESFGMRYCDSFRFLKAALDRAPSMTPAGLRAGAEAVGRTYQSALTLSTAFGPGRHDGAEQIRPFAFDDKCGCFGYR